MNYTFYNLVNSYALLSKSNSFSHVNQHINSKQTKSLLLYEKLSLVSLSVTFNSNNFLFPTKSFYSSLNNDIINFTLSASFLKALKAFLLNKYRQSQVLCSSCNKNFSQLYISIRYKTNVCSILSNEQKRLSNEQKR